MKPAARILVFTGDGKGKTTAALGMALRAAGHRMPVLVVQFIKADASTGELAALHLLDGIEIRQTGLGFVPPAGSAAFLKHQCAALQALAQVSRDLASGTFRMVILDEACTAVAKGLIPERRLMDTAEQAPPGCILVLTGRGAGSGLIGMADTVSEIRCIKHGFDRGCPAQKGVEF